MSAKVVEGWPWKRVIFVSPLPLLNVWPKRSKAVGNRALAQGAIPTAFFVLLVGKRMPIWPDALCGLFWRLDATKKAYLFFAMQK